MLESLFENPAIKNILLQKFNEVIIQSNAKCLLITASADGELPLIEAITVDTVLIKQTDFETYKRAVQLCIENNIQL